MYFFMNAHIVSDYSFDSVELFLVRWYPAKGIQQ